MSTVTVNIPSQVLTYANLAAFPVSGELLTIYIAEDTNLEYRWTGLAYQSLGSSNGVQTVTGDGVDNTDPLNPILNFPTPAEIGAYTTTEVDNEISAAVVGLLDDRGNYDASSNTFPSSGGSGIGGAILKGDLWTISVGGTLGGNAVTIGDVVRALVDSPAQTSSNWAVTENNIGYVPENNANKTDLMSGNTTSSIKILSAKGVYDWVISLGYQVALTANNFGAFLNGLTAKTSLADNDEFTITDSAASYVGKKITWTNIKSALATVFYLDATSSIQTQLDNRNTNIFKNNVQTDHTGTVNETLVLSYDVTGKFAANDLLMFACRVLGNATGNNKTVRVKVNTSASLVGAATLATYTFTSTSVLMQRNMWFANTLANIRVMANTTSYASDAATSFSGTAINTITHDFTGNTYILISCELANATDTISIYATELNRKR